MHGETTYIREMKVTVKNREEKSFFCNFFFIAWLFEAIVRCLCTCECAAKA